MTDAAMPPHSVPTEEAVLGAVLIDPGCYLDLGGILEPGDFFITRHGWIWEAFQRLNARPLAIDNLTVAEELRGMGRLEEAGGPAYITYLINNTPTAMHAESYARMVADTATRRGLLSAAGDIARLAHDEKQDIAGVTDGAEAALLSVTGRRVAHDMRTMAEIASAHYDRTAHLYKHPHAVCGVPTGLTELDAKLGGLQAGDLLVVGGRTGAGKTSFLCTVAKNAAGAGKRVAFFSLEMDGEQLCTRLAASELAIASEKIRLGTLATDEWERYTAATERLAALPLVIDDTPALTPMLLRTKCRRLWAREGLDLILVDYLQLMQAGQKYDTRTLEIGAITVELKRLARELGVPVLAAAQLNRALELRRDKHPMLSDLRESGAIENDSDVVMFLYWDAMYNTATPHPNEVEVNIAKHRSGPTGMVSLHFAPELHRFSGIVRRNVDLGDV